jgi:hypothetical protein
MLINKPLENNVQYAGLWLVAGWGHPEYGSFSCSRMMGNQEIKWIEGY